MTDEPYVLDPHVFRSFQLSLRLKNLSSHSEILPGQLELIEFSEESKTLCIEVPANTCSFGHNILITIHEAGLSKSPQLLMEATAKVQSTVAISPTHTQAIIQLVQYEEKEFQKLISLYSERQNEISKFIAESKD